MIMIMTTTTTTTTMMIIIIDSCVTLSYFDSDDGDSWAHCLGYWRAKTVIKGGDAPSVHETEWTLKRIRLSE